MGNLLILIPENVLLRTLKEKKPNLFLEGSVGMLSELDLKCKHLLLLWNNKAQGICIFLSLSEDVRMC